MADLISKIKGVDNITYDLQDKVSTFGGTNLFAWNIKEQNQEITLNNYNNTGSFTQFSNSLQFDPSETLGEKYTISFDAISPNGRTGIQLYNSNGNPKYFNFHAGTVASVEHSWVHITKTITNAQYSGTGTPSTNESSIRRIEIYAPDQMGVKIRNIKVERGSKPTDWTPALQDLITYSSETLEFF